MVEQKIKFQVKIFMENIKAGKNVIKGAYF